jgi:hypothetical protein
VIIIEQVQLPIVAGSHRISLDDQSAEMLKALASAWNERRVVSKSRWLHREQDHPEVRGYIERDLTLDLQATLASNHLTALWTAGPAWYRSFAYGPMVDWVCSIRALCVPMAAWNGTSWVART